MNPQSSSKYIGEESEGAVAVQLTGRDVFQVLFRRKWVVLILFLSTSLFVVWNASRIPTEFRAVSKVLLNRGMRNSALDRNISLLTWDETVNSELQIAESTPVIDRAQQALNDLAIEEGAEPIQIDRENVNAILMGESNILGLEYMSTVVADVQPVANALAGAYIEVHDKLFALPDVKKFFSSSVKAAEEKLETLTGRKQVVQEEGLVLRLVSQQDNLVRQKSEILLVLRTAEEEYVRRKTELEQANKMFYEENIDIPFEAELFRNSAGSLQTLFSLKKDLLTLKQKRAELIVKYTDQHPSVVLMDERIAEVHGLLRMETEEILKLKERSIAIVYAQVIMLRSQLEEVHEQFLAYPRLVKELNDLDRSIQIASESYSDLMANQVTIGVATVSSRDFTLTLLSEAGTPVESSPRDPVRLALVPAFSLLVGISLAFFIETMDHSLKSREDVERYVELPVLTSIPNRRGLS